MDVAHDYNSLSDEDIYLFREGTHSHLYRVLGAHLLETPHGTATRFAVWAPNAERVSVIGDFNGWNPDADFLASRPDSSGIWEGRIADVGAGAAYKYHIRSRYRGFRIDKGDPFAVYWETPPDTASRVWKLDYEWRDEEWMRSRRQANGLSAAWSIYEMHFGSWRRTQDNRPLGYRELAQPLAEHLNELGFTHVELMPVMEHPFYGSWGYQSVGFFAPTARYGTPQDFMYLVDYLHQQGIGVILDWVPSHFPGDAHGLAYFDGTYLYEHQDPKKGYHPEWNSYLFNYGRNEVRSFLRSSALFWLDRYHVDALRVDAVASMLYLDYARKEGEWIPNEYGGRENLEAMEFLRGLNRTVYQHFPDVQTIAEESTAWPMVSRPTELGGLGFGMKWNMGWMHDTLKFFSRDPVFRKYHHNELTFSIVYAFMENFVLSLSHDEVVYGKGSLLRKMPGDDWQRFANLRALLGYMWMHPGKKLLFMGAELAQWNEWHHEKALDWHLLEQPLHEGVRRWLRDLNRLRRHEPALYELDFSGAGFEWIDCNDSEASVLSFVRKDARDERPLIAVLNLTPTPRHSYRVGVPRAGFWAEALNSDAGLYGGSGQGNLGGVDSAPVAQHGRYHSVSLTLPPLGIVVLRHEREA